MKPTATIPGELSEQLNVLADIYPLLAIILVAIVYLLRRKFTLNSVIRDGFTTYILLSGLLTLWIATSLKNGCYVQGRHGSVQICAPDPRFYQVLWFVVAGQIFLSAIFVCLGFRRKNGKIPF